MPGGMYYAARRGGICKLCYREYTVGEFVFRVPGGRAHYECPVRN